MEDYNEIILAWNESAPSHKVLELVDWNRFIPSWCSSVPTIKCPMQKKIPNASFNPIFLLPYVYVT